MGGSRGTEHGGDGVLCLGRMLGTDINEEGKYESMVSDARYGSLLHVRERKDGLQTVRRVG